jgi:hypothetical protein
MVRPIEISDALSKAQEVGRMQQNAEMRPEAAQDFQKALNAKEHLQQTQAPNPTPAADEVVIHSDEEEKERRKIVRAVEEESARRRGGYPDKDESDNEDEDDDESRGHIDIKV